MAEMTKDGARARVRNLLCAIAIAGAALQAVAQTSPFRVLPASPFAGEDFVVIAIGSTPSSPVELESATLALSGGTLELVAHLSGGDFSVNAPYRAAAVTRVAQSGSYPVNMRVSFLGAPLFAGPIGTVAIQPSSGASLPQYSGLTGNWYHTNEPGWGLNILQNGSGQLFAIWLTYQPATPPDSPRPRLPNLGLVMPSGRWISPTQYRGVLYATFGSPVTQPFVASDSRVVPVGFASLEFVSASEARFTAEGGLQISRSFGLSPDFAIDKVVKKFLF